MSTPVDVVGVIFQYDCQGVLFEFSNGEGEEVIGFVKASDINLNSEETIPPDANTKELLCRYIQQGNKYFMRVL